MVSLLQALLGSLATGADGFGVELGERSRDVKQEVVRKEEVMFSGREVDTWR